VRVNDRTLYVSELRDDRGQAQAVVSVVAPNQVGYMFMAPELTVNELVWLVGRTDLVGPQ
jgi:hypothetical protein